MWFISAFVVGFLGSFHCIGMCGPIALALPVNKSSVRSFLTGRMLYNAGRIFTYGLLGLLAGFVGRTIAMAGFQKTLSITAGVVILIMAAISFLIPLKGKTTMTFHFLTSKIKLAFKKLFGLQSRLALFLIGAVNGLLPCGFVYLALAAAATGGSLMNGLGYMISFGAGTVPVMLSVSIATKFSGNQVRRYINKVTPWIAVTVALVLIARGILITPHTCCHHP